MEFKVNATCLLFQYELFPYLDKGNFAECTELMSRYQETLYDKEAWLSPIRKSELLLTRPSYTSETKITRPQKNISVMPL